MTDHCQQPVDRGSSLDVGARHFSVQGIPSKEWFENIYVSIQETFTACLRGAKHCASYLKCVLSSGYPACLFGSCGWTALCGRDHCSPGFIAGETENQRAGSVAGWQVLTLTLCYPLNCEEWCVGDSSVQSPVCPDGILSWAGVQEDTRRRALLPASVSRDQALSFARKSHRECSGLVGRQTHPCAPRVSWLRLW